MPRSVARADVVPPRGSLAGAASSGSVSRPPGLWRARNFPSAATSKGFSRTNSIARAGRVPWRLRTRLQYSVRASPAAVLYARRNFPVGACSIASSCY